MSIGHNIFPARFQELCCTIFIQSVITHVAHTYHQQSIQVGVDNRNIYMFSLVDYLFIEYLYNVTAFIVTKSQQTAYACTYHFGSVAECTKAIISKDCIELFLIRCRLYARQNVA